MESSSQQPEQSASLEDCLKLLKGQRDEERLAGLLFVTKLCKSDDLDSLMTVYDAVGLSFLERLLKTGLSKGVDHRGGEDSRDAFLQLSITVLAAFCRVPQIAASEDMVFKIPTILEVMSKESVLTVHEESYEFLYLVSAASQNGVTTLYQSGGMKVLASDMSSFPDGSHSMELAMKLVQVMLSKMSLSFIEDDCLSELAIIVSVIARQFAVLHNAMKFEALHLLSAIFSSEYLAPLRNALRLLPNENWSNYMRVGVVAMLHNRVAPAEKFEALILAESMVSIMGEAWLIGQINLPNVQDPIPPNRCLLLVLESSRVEVAVLLNDLAYTKYEASSSSTTAETIISKQRNLIIAFSLLENIIKLISNIGGTEAAGHPIDDGSTFTKVINGLNETVTVILEYLQDAKEHGQKKGNDLLASVRTVGSYLAETPIACKEKVRELLGYMLSIEGEEESSPFYSICFLLPMLCQVTMQVEGCGVLASSGGYKAVVDCLIKLIGQNKHGVEVENDGSIFLACDTILNFLLKREQFQFPEDESTFYNLLKALVLWTGDTNDPSVIMMASSICTLILDFTSEDALLNHPNLDNNCLISLSRLIARSLASSGQDMSNDVKAEMDLLEIITAGYSRWAHRFPQIRDAVER